MSVEPREIEDIRSFPRLPWCDDDPWTNVRARSPVHHLCLGTNQMRNSIASAVFILAGGRNPFIRWPARKVRDRAGQDKQTPESARNHISAMQYIYHRNGNLGHFAANRNTTKPQVLDTSGTSWNGHHEIDLGS